jgi:hypothetical protein
LKKMDPDDPADDAGEDVEDIVVAAIDGSEPDADHDGGEEEVDPAEPEFDPIIQHGKRIGGMQGRHGRKDIAALCIEAGEDVCVEVVVPAAEAGGVAGSMRVEGESVVLDVPGRRGGAGIVDDEADEVDEQEAEGELEEGVLVLIEEIAGKGKRQRHPAEIEAAGEDVERRVAVDIPKLIWREDYSTGAFYSEESFFEVIEAFDMDRVVPVVGEELHGIEEHPKYDEDGEAEDEAAGRVGSEEESIEEADEEELVGFEAEERRREKEIESRDAEGRQGGAAV